MTLQRHCSIYITVMCRLIRIPLLLAARIILDSSILHFTAIPSPPSSLHVSSSDWENIELQWTPGFHGGFTQHFEVAGGQGQRAGDLQQNTYNFAGIYARTRWTHAYNVNVRVSISVSMYAVHRHTYNRMRKRMQIYIFTNSMYSYQ